jgi:Tol biopolymer transport system component
MTLSAGSRLGPYEILSAVGAGGMGEVYKARDTRLERTVAVKILPARLSENPEFRQRFEREAKTISQLSHPHICTLHDVGNESGVEYLVMEFLEGETLTEKLAKGPIPLEQLLRYGIEISDALEKAHRQGIVHRDLKPGNVMITKSGVKLVDFGLAKLAAPPPGSVVSSLSVLPTQVEMGLTAEGTILGTFQYMAPEQLEGYEADGRTDIFALGLVLYEMATGRKAFSGKSQASLIAAIIHTQPEAISSVAPMTPPALDRVVRTCLAKDPDDRFQTAHDVKLQLQWIAEGGSAVGVPLPVAARRKSRERLAWAVAGLALIGALAAGAAAWRFWRASASTERLVARFSIPFPKDTRSAPGANLALSPDGTRLAFAPVSGGVSRLYLRGIGDFEAVPMRGTEGAQRPFFSPDGQWIGFSADGKLKKVSVDGGSPLALCDAAVTRGASWGPDDVILFAPNPNTGLWAVPAAGGKAEQVTTPDSRRGEFSHRWPDILPGGKAALFAIAGAGNADQWRIALLDLDTRKWTVLVEGGSHPRYVSPGHIVYAQAGSLLAVPFDLENLEVVGSPAPVLEELVTGGLGGAASYAVSATGALAYAPGAAGSGRFEAVWVDRRGAVQPLPVTARDFDQPRVSPDGRQVAVTVRGENPDVWAGEVARGTLTRLTFEPSEDETAVWSPDSKQIAFAASRGASRQILRRSADGSGSEEILFRGERHSHVSDWTRDGKTLVVMDIGSGTGPDIWVLPLEGDRKPRPFLQAPFNENWPRLSPDGRWLAYESNEAGRLEIYVQPFPGPGGKWQVSTDGGSRPVWAPSGREIFYRQGDRVMVAPIEAGSPFAAGTPRSLFEGRFEEAYDVAPDGNRFLMLRNQDAALVPQLNVVIGWSEELGQRLTKKR